MRRKKILVFPVWPQCSLNLVLGFMKPRWNGRSPDDQKEFNKVLLENVMKTQFTISKVLAMDSLSPHINGDDRFDFKSMVMNIRDDAREVVERFFPSQDEEE